MPRYASAQLRWSEPAQIYLFSIDDQVGQQAFTHDWLEQHSSFAFYSSIGMHYTARKQKVQRGSSYWYAYRRLHGRIVKHYLGKTVDLTLDLLEEIAYQLAREAQADSTPALPSQAEEPSRSALEEWYTEKRTPLLLSKLSPPRLPAFLLERSRLLALLDASRAGILTLLSAPAGFGKSILVRQWMEARRTSPTFPILAWVCLEEADNEPQRFWRYLLAASQSFEVDLAQSQAALARSGLQPPFLPSDYSPMLAALLNALAQARRGVILVLEDYHVITDHTIHETLAFFLNHLPVTCHVMILTRRDPPFSLSRLRARQGLCEIRTAELRFSREETALLLHHSLPFELSAAVVERLHAQLEGWGVGVHLMGQALRRASMFNEEEQILALCPRDTLSLQEYFVSEVLDQQAEEVQAFLLQTSLLARLNASLCDAVTEQQNSQDMLLTLTRAHLFLELLEPDVPHQAQASLLPWYRYHTLFAEVLRGEARRRLGEDRLHRLLVRASHWYEAHGFQAEATEFALAGQDYPRATHLLVQTVREQIFPGSIREPHTLLRQLEQLPATLLEQSPLLCLGYALVLLFQSTSWKPEATVLPLLERRLQAAESGFRHEQDTQRLGELLAFRALLALRQGDSPGARTLAQQALAHLEQTSVLWRGIMLSIVAEAQLEQGYFQQAHALLLDAQAQCEDAHNQYFLQIVRSKLAQILFEQGESQFASAVYRQVVADAPQGGPLYVQANALFGLALLGYENNDLAGAAQYAQEAFSFSQSHHLLYYEVHAQLLLARVQYAEGQLLVAQQQLATLLEKIWLSAPELAQEIQATQAQLALFVGDQLLLQRWASSRVPPTHFTRHIEEELLLVRWLRLQGQLDDAADRLASLLALTRQGEHARRVLEITLEMALLEAARQHKTEAQHWLREALALAARTSATRLFLDAGEPMAVLLRSVLPLLHAQPMQALVRTLLSAFPPHQTEAGQVQASALIEPLSPQELRVLRLLAEHRSNAEIAATLVVSINTVRTQVQSIYSKLGVHKRGAASEIARELNLL